MYILRDNKPLTAVTAYMLKYIYDFYQYLNK